MADFESRTNFPAVASRNDLMELGARYLRSDSFTEQSEIYRLEQMQLERNGNMYLWKRIGPEKTLGSQKFEIHLEITPTGYNYYQTLEEKVA